MLTRRAIRAKAPADIFNQVIQALPGDPDVPRKAKGESYFDYRKRCRDATEQALVNPARLPLAFNGENFSLHELTRERILMIVALVDRYFSAKGAYMQLWHRHQAEAKVVGATLEEPRTAAWFDMDHLTTTGWTLSIQRPVWENRVMTVCGVDVEGNRLRALICCVCRQLAYMHQFETHGHIHLDLSARQTILTAFGLPGSQPNSDNSTKHIR